MAERATDANRPEAGRGGNALEFEALGAEAVTHATYLAGEIGPRGSCTEQEHRGLDYAERHLRRLGIREVRGEDFVSPVSAWRPFVVCIGLTLVAAPVYPLAGRATALISFCLAALSLYWAWRELHLDRTWLARWLPRGESRNVFGVIPPQQRRRQRVVILAHVDTHRSPPIFQSQENLRWFRTLLSLGLGSLVLSTALFALGLLTQWSWISWAILIPIIPQVIALFFCLQADWSPYSPGANDNAVSVGGVLALGRRLQAEPLERTEVWLLFTGCEEVGCYGMSAFLEQHKPELRGRRTYFVDFELIGHGEPAFVTREGMVRKIEYSPELIAHIEAINQRVPEVKARPHIADAYGESVVIAKAGYPTTTLGTLIPGTNLAAYWHQMTDTPDKLRAEDTARVLHLTWELLQELDHRAAATR